MENAVSLLPVLAVFAVALLIGFIRYKRYEEKLRD